MPCSVCVSMQWAYSHAMGIHPCSGHYPKQYSYFPCSGHASMQCVYYHKMCILPFILPMQYSNFTCSIQTSHAVFILPMQWACFHAVGMHPCSAHAPMQCSYSHAVCILRAHASMQCVSCLAYFVTGVSYDRKMLITHFPFCPDVINLLQVFLTIKHNKLTCFENANKHLYRQACLHL